MTSGIDFGLTVIAELAGEEVAEEVQLQVKYDPEPPYQAGSLRSAPAELVARTREKIAPLIARWRVATERAAERLRTSV